MSKQHYRPAAERGSANFGWLDTSHTFSFGNYYDPKHMGFSTLRVINDDHIAGGGGFPMHGHRDMEIVTVVLDGTLEHKDSMGNGSLIVPGDVQRMSAGTGVRHSEFNASPDLPVHLLQIWMLPEQQGIAPGYEQKHFARETGRGQLVLLASRDGREGSVLVHQDVNLYRGLLLEGQSLEHIIGGRDSWLQVISGDVTVNGQQMVNGDGLAIEGAREISFAAAEESEFLLFELEPRRMTA